MSVAFLKNKPINLSPAKYSFKFLGHRLSFVAVKNPLAVYILAAGLVVFAVYVGNAYTVTIPVDSKPVVTVRSYNRNTDEILTEVDLALNPEDNPEDRVRPDTATPLSGQTEIQIEKTFPVYVLDKDSITEIWTSQKPVKELLKEEGFLLSSNDRLEPEGTVYPGAEIKIFRAEKVDSAVSNTPDQSKEIRQVSSAGLHRGTNRFTQTGLTGTTIKFNQVIVVTATAYCPGTPESGCPLNSQGHSLCTDCYNDGYTCTGKKAVQGEGTLELPHIVAVDPRIIPLASKIYLEGIGFAVAEDIGGSIQGNRIDILFNLHRDAREFGLRKGIKLYILTGIE